MKVVYGSVFVFSVFALLPNMAVSAPEPECDRYAKTAKYQYDEAKALGMKTAWPVWSDDYNHHF